MEAANQMLIQKDSEAQLIKQELKELLIIMEKLVNKI